MIKTAEELAAAAQPYQVFQAHLYNGVMFVAYQTPNKLWWSSWHMGNPVEDLNDLCDFVAYDQPPDWPGWVRLVPDPKPEPHPWPGFCQACGQKLIPANSTSCTHCGADDLDD